MKLVAVLGVSVLACALQTSDAVAQYAYVPAGAYAIGPYPRPVIADAFEVNPLDDGYVSPFGYGEYAVYGRWAVPTMGGGCELLHRRFWTGSGYRWRTIRRCY